MPCYDERDSPEYIRADYQNKINILQNKVDNLTRMLCSLCKVDPNNVKQVLGLDNWWVKHQELDKARAKSKRL